MAKIWKERFNRVKHRNPMFEIDWGNSTERDISSLFPHDVYFVEVCAFTFEFHSVTQIKACLAFYSKKLHPSSRIKIDGGDHWEYQRWFERLPLFLRKEPKRSKVVEALNNALLHFSKVRSSPALRRLDKRLR